MTLALLFSPQGSQVVGMGRDLAESHTAARDVFALADEAVGWSVSDVAWDGPAERLNDTRQTQPCLVATSLACLAALRAAAEEAGTRLAPRFVAGHSVGEYAALAAAGVLSTVDAIRLVARRGALMADAEAEGGMAAVIGLDRAAVADAIAAVASPADLVVAIRRKLHTDAVVAVISGYRTPETNAMLAARSDGVAHHSLHVDGLALDWRVPGR